MGSHWRAIDSGSCTGHPCRSLGVIFHCACWLMPQYWSVVTCSILSTVLTREDISPVSPWHAVICLANNCDYYIHPLCTCATLSQTLTFDALTLSATNSYSSHAERSLLVVHVFTRHSCTGRYCWERILAMGILSVCPSVTTRWYTKHRWDRDSVSSPYDSLDSLESPVSYEVIWWHWVRRFPSHEGIKEGTPLPLEIIILPLLAHLAWKRLQIDADLLRIIASTADELSSGTNIDGLEPPK